MTSMSSQIDSLRFINEGSTKRKEALAKFLDLEFFEKKYAFVDESIPPDRKTPTSTSDIPLYLIDSFKVLVNTL